MSLRSGAEACHALPIPATNDADDATPPTKVVQWSHRPPPYRPSTFPEVHARMKDAIPIAAMTAAYLVASRLGLTFAPAGGFGTLVWPATGMSLAALLIFGTRLWPGVFVGATLSSVFLSGAPLSVAAGIGIGNTLEAFTSAYLLRQLPGFQRSLETFGTVIGLLVAAIFSTMISATVGVASLDFGGIIPAGQERATWQGWWIGDMVGALLAAPIILVWTTPPRARFRQHWSEAVLLGAAMIAASLMTFLGDSPGIPTLPTPFHVAFVLLAVVIWAALR